MAKVSKHEKKESKAFEKKEPGMKKEKEYKVKVKLKKKK